MADSEDDPHPVLGPAFAVAVMGTVAYFGFQNYPKTTAAIIAAVAFWLFCITTKPKWPKWKRAWEERKRLRALRDVPPFPPRAEFTKQLTAEWVKSGVTLSPEIADRLITIMSEVYFNEVRPPDKLPKDRLNTYETLFESFLYGLEESARFAPPEYKELPTGFTFDQAAPLTEEMVFHLRIPFRENESLLRECFDWNKLDGTIPRPSIPEFADGEDPDVSERKLKDYDKAREAVIRQQAKLEENIPEEAKPYRYTPYFPAAYTQLQSITYRRTFSPPPARRFEGTWIIAPPGRGKTTLLHSMFLEDVKTDACIILMDSKGDLINPIKKLKEIEDRLVILEPDALFPLALNPLDLGATQTHTVALLEHLFSALLDTKTTALQSTLFRSVLMVMTAIPGATFSTFRDFLLHGYKGNAAYEAAIRTLHPEDQEFFFKGEYDSKTYQETKQQLLWRIRDLTTRIPLLREMFRAPKTKINMGELMDAGKIIVIDNSKQLLDDDGAEFIGRFFIALVRAAANQRSNRKQADKRPVFFYIDECHTVIRRDEKIAGIIQECRSQNIAMVLAHQATSQISSPVTLSALTDCAIRMTNPDEEAELLAPRLRTTTDFLQSLKRGEFATYVRDYTAGAVKLHVPYQDFAELPQMSVQEQTALKERMRFLYAITPEEEPIVTPPPKQGPRTTSKPRPDPQPEASGDWER